MPPTSVVTGAAGRIGGRVAARLRLLGHRVVGVDLAPAPAGLIGSSCDDFVQCDLAAAADNMSAAHAALSQACTAASVVVHCAAWPGPSSTPPPAVIASGAATDQGIGLEPTSPPMLLRDNVGATSAVCDAAVRGGASRVVFSSSAFAMGWSHAAAGAQAYRPKYMPVDEAHGALPHETYGLSKLAGEQVLEAAARTARGTSFVSLRFPNIIKAEKWSTLPWPAPTAADPLNLLMWAYAHEDDVVDAHVAAATRPDAAAVGAHEAYLIAAPDSRFAEPTLELLEAALGVSGVPTRPGFGGNDSPLSSAKAAERLGWRPRSWQQERDAAADLGAADADATVGSSAASMPPYGLGSGSALRARADPALRHFDLGGFVLRSGAALPAGATLAYRVHGPPVGEAPGGVILHPTSFDAVHDELEYQIGPGRALDTDRYTVVVPNLLGNGVSHSPSLDVATATAGGTRLPQPLLQLSPPAVVTIADNVAAQKAMLREALGIGCDAADPLALVYGYSMGALQAYEWAVAEPEGVRAIAAVCGAARCGELNHVFLRSIEAALKADGAWDDAACRFSHRPTRGLEAFASIYAGWGVGEAWYTSRAFEAAGYASAEEFLRRSYVPAFAGCDGDDLLAQIHAWRLADVAAHTGGDLARALARVQARVLLMPCTTDKYFTLVEATREAAALGDRVTLKPIVSAAGHRAGDPHRPELKAELEFIRTAVHELLEGSDDE